MKKKKSQFEKQTLSDLIIDATSDTMTCADKTTKRYAPILYIFPQRSVNLTKEDNALHIFNWKNQLKMCRGRPACSFLKETCCSC